MQKLIRCLAAAAAIVGLQGCLVTTVVGVAAGTVEAGVGITGAAVGAVVDVVTDDDDAAAEKKED